MHVAKMLILGRFQRLAQPVHAYSAQPRLAPGVARKRLPCVVSAGNFAARVSRPAETGKGKRMHIRTNPRELRLVPRRDLRRVLACVMAAATCGAALYQPPAQAAEPLECNFGFHPVVNVVDARYVGAGTTCATDTVNVLPAGQLANDGTLLNVVRMNNASGGQIANGVDGSMQLYGGFDNKGSLVNAGQLQTIGTVLSVNTGTFTNAGGYASHAGLVNSGAFANLGGMFENGSTLTNGATFVNSANATLMNTGHVFNTGTLLNVTGADIINNPNSTITNVGTLQSLGGGIVNSGTLDNLGTFTNQLGKVTNVGHLSNMDTLKNGLQGTIENLGTLTNIGTFTNQFQATLKNFFDLDNLNRLENETGATLDNTGRLSNAAPAILENDGTLNNARPGRLENAGRLYNNPGATLDSQGRLSNTATAKLVNGGTLINGYAGELDNAGTLGNQAGAQLTNNGTLVNDGTFTNAGTVVSSGAIRGAGTYVQTGGTTTLAWGNRGLSQREVRIEDGVLAGSGSITSYDAAATIAASALLTPGERTGDVGRMAINGALDLFGSLDIEVIAQRQFDSVTASNIITFSSDGSTWFNFYLDNYADQGDGDSFDFFDALSFVNFDAVNFRCFGLLAGLDCRLDLVDNGTGLQLALFNVTGGGNGGGGVQDVPEPGALGLMCLGLALLGMGLGWRRWRTTHGA